MGENDSPLFVCFTILEWKASRFSLQHGKEGLSLVFRDQ